MAEQLSTTKRSGFMMGTNPMIRKLSKVQETDSANSCSYAGITVKLVYFMVVVLAGVLLNVIMAGKWGGELLPVDNEILRTITVNEAIAVGVAALMLVIMPFVALIRVTIPVSGAGNYNDYNVVVTLTAKVYGASGDWTLPVNAHFTKIDGVWYSHN